jgi:DNA-binding transcriptional ArsR family regulator
MPNRILCAGQNRKALTDGISCEKGVRGEPATRLFSISNELKKTGHVPAYSPRILFRFVPNQKYENIRIFMSELSRFKAEFFKALAHPLRIRILDELRKGEMSVNDLGSRLNVEQSNLSQQLAVLRNRNILAARKDGQNVYYSVRDPQLFDLLDVARKIFNSHLIDVKDLLSQLTVARR